jgi:hypothetical protein
VSFGESSEHISALLKVVHILSTTFGFSDQLKHERSPKFLSKTSVE